MKTLVDCLYDITNYLRIPHQQVFIDYQNAKVKYVGLFPSDDLLNNQRKTLQQVYDKYAKILLDGVD
jgi:hypothetical protein